MLRLWFTGFDSPQLVRTEFAQSFGSRSTISVRGKTPGAYRRGEATFQWTKAVQALTSFLVRASAASRRAPDSSGSQPILKGGFGSPAASLDYAVGKPPAWLVEMFGETRSGDPIVRRMIMRTNPERKRGGDVELGLNSSVLAPETIEIFVGDAAVESADDCERLTREIESAWKGSSKARPFTPVPSRRLPERESVPGNPEFLETVQAIYFEESVRTLQHTDIFTRAGLERVHARIARDLSVPGEAHFCRDLLAPAAGGLEYSSRLGILPPELRSRLLDSPPIHVALPCGNPGATEIFNYLRWTEKFPFTVDFRFHYAIEIMHKILNHSFFEPPKLCLLGLAPAATMAAQGAKTGYLPIMVMPAVSHRILAPNTKKAKPGSRLDHGEFVFLREEYSTSQIYFDLLSYAGDLRKDRVETHHAEPDEAFAWLGSGEEHRRALLFFPYHAINRRMNNCSYLDEVRGDVHLKDFILFAHESLIADKQLLEAVCVVIRDAWIKLRSGGKEYQDTLRRMMADKMFTGVLERFSGADSVRP